MQGISPALQNSDFYKTMLQSSSIVIMLCSLVYGLR